jgi:hypothetical protein
LGAREVPPVPIQRNIVKPRSLTTLTLLFVVSACAEPVEIDEGTDRVVSSNDEP